MKILYLNSSDTQGGAAKAAFRLMTAVREHGIEVSMLVRDKQSDDNDVVSSLDFGDHGVKERISHFIWRIKNRIRKQKWKKYPDRENVFLNDLDSVPLLHIINTIDFDILHLHFVANRFLNISELKKINKPIVWTLHDCWPFTGICHYFYDCTRYQHSCGCCPMLHSHNKSDFTHRIWKKKKQTFEACNIHIVTPSNWLGKHAACSFIFRNTPISVIPNPIDTALFSPGDKQNACTMLQLNPDKRYILYSAMNAIGDKNKGFDKLLEALKHFKTHETLSHIELLVTGADKPIHELSIDIPTRYLGTISEETRMVAAYRAASVMILPSLSENLSYSIMESMACGTPVVAFQIGGNEDLIDHKQNGYLAKALDAEDLAKGLEWCLSQSSTAQLSKTAREKVLNNYTASSVSSRYIHLYNSLLHSDSHQVPDHN